MTKKSQISLVIFLISFLGLMILSFLVVNDYVSSFDSAVYNFVTAAYQAPVTLAAQLISALGSPLVILAFCMLLLGLNRNRREILLISFYTFLVYLFNTGFKNFIMRAIPTKLHLIDVVGYSFPSEAVCLAMIFYGLLLMLLFKKIDKIGLKRFLLFLYVVLIGSIGFSRVYLGANYITDVIAAILLAMVSYSAVMFIGDLIRIISEKKRKQAERIADPEDSDDQEGHLSY